MWQCFLVAYSLLGHGESSWLQWWLCPQHCPLAPVFLCQHLPCPLPLCPLIIQPISISHTSMYWPDAVESIGLEVEQVWDGDLGKRWGSREGTGSNTNLYVVNGNITPDGFSQLWVQVVPATSLVFLLKDYHSGVLVGSTSDNAAFSSPLINATKVCLMPFCQPWLVAHTCFAMLLREIGSSSMS